MDVSVWSVITATIVGAIISPITQFMLQGLQAKQAKRQILFEKRAIHLLELENAIGHLLETACSYTLTEDKKQTYSTDWTTIDRLRGYFYRNVAINQEIREILQYASIVIDGCRTSREADESKEQLHSHYFAFLKEVDKEYYCEWWRNIDYKKKYKKFYGK